MQVLLSLITCFRHRILMTFPCHDTFFWLSPIQSAYSIRPVPTAPYITKTETAIYFIAFALQMFCRIMMPIGFQALLESCLFRISPMFSFSINSNLENLLMFLLFTQSRIVLTFVVLSGFWTHFMSAEWLSHQSSMEVGLNIFIPLSYHSSG